MRNDELYLLPYAGTAPALAAPAVHAGTGSAVLGRATIGRDGWFGTGSVVRADGHYVTIGHNFRLGPRSTVHIAHEVLPTEIGANVTAGSNSVIHACTVGDDCHIGDNVVILDGSEVAAGCAIADGSTVFPRSTLEGGWLYEGSPAKPVRRLTPGELDALHVATRSKDDRDTLAANAPDVNIEADGPVFVAASAKLSGKIVAVGENGIWFGCRLDAGEHEIRIGCNTNIQDNTTIRCVERIVDIGRDATIGHNVLMTDCTVGDASLIGMGAVVAPGTVVEPDVLLAAGAFTLPGQVLQSGWLYGGRPARKLSQLDEKKRSIIRLTWPTYCDYARRFDDAQRQLDRMEDDDG